MQYVELYSTNFTKVFSSLINFMEIKALGGLVVAAYAFFFHVPHWHLMAALIALLTFDLVTGIAASKLSGEEIKSKRVLKTPLKFFIYSILISTAHLTEVILNLPGAFSVLEQAMIGFLAITEMVSIIENSGRMGFAIPKRLLNQLQQYRDGEAV